LLYVLPKNELFITVLDFSTSFMSRSGCEVERS